MKGEVNGKRWVGVLTKGATEPQLQTVRGNNGGLLAAEVSVGEGQRTKTDGPELLTEGIKKTMLRTSGV